MKTTLLLLAALFVPATFHPLKAELTPGDYEMITVLAPTGEKKDSFPYSEKVKVVEKSKGKYEIILPKPPITISYNGGYTEESPKECDIMQSKNGIQFQSSMQHSDGKIYTKVFSASVGNNEERYTGSIYNFGPDDFFKVGVFTLAPVK